MTASNRRQPYCLIHMNRAPKCCIGSCATAVRSEILSTRYLSALNELLLPHWCVSKALFSAYEAGIGYAEVLHERSNRSGH